MSHHDIIIFVNQNKRQTPEPLLDRKFFEVHSARRRIFQSKGLRAFASLGECPHPTDNTVSLKPEGFDKKKTCFELINFFKSERSPKTHSLHLELFSGTLCLFKYNTD